jgi:hypothetical protein
VRFLRLVGRCGFELLFAACVLACGLAFVLHRLPQSRWAHERLRAELVRALGPAAAEVDFDQLSVHWFQPRIEVTGLRLGPLGRDARIELARAHLRWKAWPWSSSGSEADSDKLELCGLEFEGGRLCVSQTWIESLDSSTLSSESGRNAAWPESLPPILVRDLELVLVTKEEREVHLGQVEAYARQRADTLTLTGELRSSVGLQSAATVHLEGSGRLGQGFELKAWGSELRVSRDRVAAFLPASFVPLGDFNGVFDLVCGARLPDQPGAPAEAWIELRLHDGSLQLESAQRFEQAEVALSLACRAEELEALWLRDAWSGQATVHASWNRTLFAARARLGRSAGPGYLLRGSIEVPELRLERELLEALGLWSYASRDWEALEPRGSCRLAAGVSVPMRGGTEPLLASLRATEAAVDLVHTGASGITFRGWVERDGRAHGFPLPVTNARGRTLCVLEPRSARPLRLGLLELEGRVADGTESRPVHCRGFLGSARTGKRPDLDLEIDIPEITLGGELKKALDGMPETAWIWGEFNPSGGTVSTHWRLLQNEELQGLAAAGDVRCSNITASWSDLGIPLQHLTGDLRVRFGAYPTEIRSGGVLVTLHRPVGVAFELAGKADTSQSASIKGLVRGETLPRVLNSPLEQPRHELQWVDVLLTRIPWTGGDVEALSKWESEIERRIKEFNPSGFADAHWAGGRTAPEAPYRWDLEIGLLKGRVQPELLGPDVREVDGRVLISSTREDTEGRAPARSELAVGLALRGQWTGATVAVAAHADAGAPLELEFHAAGVDPANAAVLGSVALLRSRGAAGERGVDRSSLALSGRLDLHGALRFELAGSDTARPTITAWPRGMALRWGSFALEDVNGLVRLEDDVLRAEELRARMSATPVVLQRVRLMPESALARLPGESARLGDVRVPAGSTVFLADLGRLQVPLDREHLGAFVDPAGLERLERFGLGGELDVEGLRLLVFGDAGSGGSVHANGRIALRDFRAAVGIPIEIEHGILDLESLVIERGRVRGWAHLSDGAGSIAGRTFEAASLVASFVDGRLNIDDLSSGFQGGRLSSLGGERGNAFALDLGEPYHFSLALELAEVQLQGLLKGVFDSGIADSGTCDARLRLSGRFADLTGMQGSGTIELLDTRLWSIPVVRSLFSQLGFDASATFQEMRTRLELRDGEIRMKPIVVSSPLLRLEGSGRVGLDGRLRHDFELRYQLVDRLGPFTRLLYWVQNNLLRVAVRGDIARPIVILRSTLTDLFRERDSLQRHLPLPGFSEIPRRF